MDRLLSLFSLYDILGYLLSGLALLVGLYWIAEGVPSNPSTALVLALLGVGYAVGQLVAIPGRIWEGLWWRRHGGEPAQRMLDDEAFGFSSEVRLAIKDRISADIGVAELSSEQRFEVARSRLRLAGFDTRAELLRAMHGLCRNLSASCFVVGVAAIVALLWSDDTERLLLTGALALAAALMFAVRTVRFQRRFAEQIWLDYLALGASRAGPTPD